jgi:hypothetical protein
VIRTAGRVCWALTRRPHLWGTAIRQTRRTARPGWWRHRPFLPVPSGAYLRFRLQTQYGDTDTPPDPSDVVSYLEWCRDWDRTARPT